MKGLKEIRMANPKTLGNKTSEHDLVKDAQKWIRIAAGLVSAIAASLLASGVIPEDSAWIAVLTLVVTVTGAITGEVVLANNYAGKRSALKIANARLAAAEKMARVNPPKTPENQVPD
jgi:membrane protein YdbS with pleckstrin-like domain